jgi:hypothetical protein
MRHIVCYQGVGAAVDGRFEHHLVVGVRQLRTPDQMRFDRLDQKGQGIQGGIHIDQR